MQGAVRLAGPARGADMVVDEGVGHRRSPCLAGAPRRSLFMVRMLMAADIRDLRGGEPVVDARLGQIGELLHPRQPRLDAKLVVRRKSRGIIEAGDRDADSIA